VRGRGPPARAAVLLCGCCCCALPRTKVEPEEVVERAAAVIAAKDVHAAAGRVHHRRGCRARAGRRAGDAHGRPLRALKVERVGVVEVGPAVAATCRARAHVHAHARAREQRTRGDARAGRRRGGRASARARGQRESRVARRRGGRTVGSASGPAAATRPRGSFQRQSRRTGGLGPPRGARQPRAACPRAPALSSLPTHPKLPACSVRVPKTNICPQCTTAVWPPRADGALPTAGRISDHVAEARW
jgi:hypothetical protein